MGIRLSPLRYPGGKTKIYNKVKCLIEKNNLNERIYVEPYAGGFGVGIALLENEVIYKAILNEYDKHVFNFWHTVFNNPDELVNLIMKTDVTMEERKRQKDIYLNGNSSVIEDGFATLFLNRVNYSGVLFGGPIGGNNQTGKYLLNCRFNKQEICRRVQTIAKYKNNVSLYNCDAIKLIKDKLSKRSKKMFYNIDPPYVIKGKSLYSKYYKIEDHIKLRDAITNYLTDVPWIVTYDNCDLIKDLYSNYFLKEYDMYYSACNKGTCKELVITNMPKKFFIW